MSRPNLIRADTLDLQDHEAPSAQDHQNQPNHPAPFGAGPPAPHQDLSLRHAQEDRAAEQDYLVDQWGSGRSSHEGSDLLDEDTEYLTDHHAVHPNGAVGRSSDDSDMTDADDENGVDDDIVDKISSSPSIDDEDIDFEFVYALHTFVATVEGQANATKGDTMQLLDDSNSYWWLVRVCKDSSIGYLPAEHIETPTERLARLNKHRNADLSREHLGDSETKPKSMLKQALKRRTAKIVQFTTPTYYEASEIDWSETDEQDAGEGDMDEDEVRNGQTGQEIGQNTTHEQSSTMTATTTAQSAESDAATAVQNAAPSPTVAVAEVNQLTDPERPSDDSLERSDSSSSKRSRNGNIRNTDSFFKDETAEPKKMSLTPSLLRDADQGSASTKSSDSREKVMSPVSETFENIDKTSPTSDKFRDDKKKKKDKPGMLSGLFKRKEKKIKVDEAAGGTVRTSQSDLEGMLASPTSSSPVDSAVTSPKEQSSQSSRRPSAAGGKLVKPPPPSLASQVSSPNAQNQGPSLSGPQSITNRTTQPELLGSVSSTGAASAQRGDSAVTSIQGGRQPLRIQTTNSNTPTPTSIPGPSPASAPHKDDLQRDASGLSPISGFGRDLNVPKKVTQRMELEVDSSPEQEVAQPTNVRNAAHTPPPRMAPSAPRQEPFKLQSISPMDPPTHPDGYPPVLEPSKSAQSESPVSPSTPTESTSTINTPETASEEPKSSTAATSSTPDSKAHVRLESDDGEWDDAALYYYLENKSSTDVRDLLLLVHDNNDVKPVSKDHPIMKDLNFEQHQKKLDEMSNQLDGLLNDFLARKATKRKAALKT